MRDGLIAEPTHPLRLLRMEAMPITMLATDRALAAFLRANSLSCCWAAWSVRSSLWGHWKRPETTAQAQLATLPVQPAQDEQANIVRRSC